MLGSVIRSVTTHGFPCGVSGFGIESSWIPGGSGSAAVNLRDRIVVGREGVGRESDAFGERGLALTEILVGQGVWKFKMVQQEGVTHGERRVWNVVYYYNTHS